MHDRSAMLTGMMLPAHLPAYTLPPALLAKARSLARLSATLYFGGTAWLLLALGLLLRARAGAAIAEWADRLSSRRGTGPFRSRPLLQGLLVSPMWLLMLAGISLPLQGIGHAAALRYGLSIERWGAWWVDWLKAEALTLFLGTLLISGVFLALRRAPRLWWVWVWLAAQPVVLVSVFLAPVIVDPMFSRFTPLAQQDPALAQQLEHVAVIGGLHIPISRMFVEDASRRSTGMNAYVTGIGASRRIVVWDTTIAKLPADEILAIYAHEQGHYVLHHIAKGIAFAAGLSLLLLSAGAWLLPRLVRSLGDRWHIPDPEDWAALPLVLLLATALNFVAAPAANAFSRWEENQADVYGEHLLARVLPDAPNVEVQDFNRLGRVWLDEPAPNRFLVWWMYTHPPTAERAAQAARLWKR